MRSSALFVLAAIITTSTGLAGNASAQEISIETAADDHGGRFFGEGVLQVVVTDLDAVDDDIVEEVSVAIKAVPDAGSSSSEDIAVPETNEGSGRFELFLVHVDATAVEPADLDPINSAGVEGDGSCVTDCAPFVTFGPGGDIDIDSDLYEDVRFEILAGNTEITVSYEETEAALQLDRDSYGTTSYVYISVVDQDANLNPRENDQFMVDSDDLPNDDLLALEGGNLEDMIVFRETGDNTAVFEGRYRLGESILVESKSLVLTLFDKADYNATLDVEENDSNNTDEVSFTVGDSAGSVDIGRGEQVVVTWDPLLEADKDSYAVGESIHLTITDQDANANSGLADSLQLRVVSGGIEIEVTALETGADTGVFEASFQLVDETDVDADAIDLGGSATITYTDERPADYFEKVQAGENPKKDFNLEIDVQLPDRTGIEATDVTVPVAEDVAGGSGPYSVGDSVTLSTEVSNNNDEPRPFVALIEVRDSNGVTVFLALRSGTLEPSGSADIGVLWQPDQAGTFEVRTFLVTSISMGAEVLSPVASSEVTVT